MNRHNPAMAKYWLDVAWGGPTATTSSGVWGGLWLAMKWRRCVQGKMSGAPHDRRLWPLDRKVRNSTKLAMNHEE